MSTFDTMRTERENALIQEEARIANQLQAQGMTRTEALKAAKRHLEEAGAWAA